MSGCDLKCGGQKTPGCRLLRANEHTMKSPIKPKAFRAWIGTKKRGGKPSVSLPAFETGGRLL